MEKKRVFGTGGELLVHQLVAQGVRYAFTNTGSAEAGFFNALLTVPGVQPILLLAESLVLSAADGYAKAARKPAFVNVHLAAGTRQGSGQLQNAYFDGTPMVVTAAMRDVGSYGDHGALVASGGFSQMGAVEDITKRRWEVWDAGRDPDRHAARVQGRHDVPHGSRLRGVRELRRWRPPTWRRLIQAADAAAHGSGAGGGRHPRDLGRAPQCREAPAGVRAGHRRGGRGGGDPRRWPSAWRCPWPPASSTTPASPRITRTTRAASRPSPKSGYDVVCCVGYRQNTRGNATDLRFPPRAPSSASATIRRSSAIPSRSTSRCGAMCGTRSPPSTPRGRTRDARLPHLERRARRPALARASSGCASFTTRPWRHASDKPIHPNYLAQVAGERAARGHDGRVRELPQRRPSHAVRLRQAPVAARPELRRLTRAWHRRGGRGAARRPGSPGGVQPRGRRRDVQRLRLLDHGAIRPADPDRRLEQPQLPDGAHQLPHLRRRDGQAEEVPRGLPRRAGDRLRDAREGAGNRGHRRSASPRPRRPRCGGASTPSRAGEPYLLDIRVATVGTGADSTWHQRFKLRD